MSLNSDCFFFCLCSLSTIHVLVKINITVKWEKNNLAATNKKCEKINAKSENKIFINDGDNSLGKFNSVKPWKIKKKIASFSNCMPECLGVKIEKT